MPNWSFNSLSISGTPEEIQQIKAQVSAPFEKEYDNWKTEDNTYVRQMVSHSNPVFAFWNIVRPPADKMDEYNATHGYGKEGRTGDTEFNWYNFNIREWGTKWDVSVSDNEEYPETELITDLPDHLAYRFNTAWSPPMPAIAKLSTQYPNAVFDLEYEEETGWGGEIVFKNGEVVSSSEYDNKCRECDEIDCMEWDEETSEEVCTKCQYRF